MSPTDNLADLPRVAAVLVVHNGAEWLGSVLATIAAQRYPALDLVVVDNASIDGSADLLARRVPADRLVTLTRNVGFARAVAAASAHPAVAAADLLLLLHDDLVLAPEAIGELVDALQADASLALVGPKLREWSDEGLLAEVGMTIDRFGRTEPRAEPGELDQGQHDRPADVLYVNTGGMLLRRELLRELGGFDARFRAYRDDLDLCWRAWLYGYRVGVVPAAVGYHIGAGGRAGRRLGAGRAVGRRYLAERHAVASLLKNYSAPRLAWVLPVVVLLAVAKTLVFVAIRRFGEAGAVVRAYGWNVMQLPRTLRRRRTVQRRRSVSDGELARLFAPGLPRARGYLEGFGAWLAGGSTRALLDEDAVTAAEEDRLAGRTLLRFLRDRPAAVAATVLLGAYLVGLVPLLGAGQVVGGEVAPWPDDAGDFLTAYLTPFNGEPVGTAGLASPIQALLGVASLAGMGSAWLAQRLLVFGLLPLGWLLALRAGRLITERPGPRALGATLYALSPVVLGALAQGRYGVLVVAALLPGLVTVAARAGDASADAAGAWRATAILSLGVATAIAAAPSLAPLLVGGLLVGVVAVAVRRAPGSRGAALRLGLATVTAAVLLSPWLVGLVVSGSLAAAVGVGADPAPLPMWRALSIVPEALPGLGGLGGVLTALTSAAVVAASLLLGLRRRPDLVALLAGVAAVAAVAAWGVDRSGVDWLWAPAVLLPAALAVAGLGVLAAHSVVDGLREHAFGARQLSVIAATAMLGVGLVGGVARLADGPYAGLARDPQLVPAFVGADVDRVGPYRVLLLTDPAGEVRWDVTDATGPSMVGFGTTASADLLDVIGDAVAGITGGGDPQAGAALGLANVRYVVIAAGGASAELSRALADQPLLEPLPSGAGRVYRVRSWLPRAVVLPEEVGEQLLATGDQGDTEAFEERGLPRRSGATYAGQAVAGLLVLGEAGSRDWQATVASTPLEPVDPAAGPGPVAPVNAWRVPVAGQVVVAPGGRARHLVVVALQALLVAGVVSLALRPPGFTQRREERRRGGDLPRELAGIRAPEVSA